MSPSSLFILWSMIAKKGRIVKRSIAPMLSAMVPQPPFDLFQPFGEFQDFRRFGAQRTPCASRAPFVESSFVLFLNRRFLCTNPRDDIHAFLMLRRTRWFHSLTGVGSASKS